jgi:hypothetical protein
MLSRSCLLARLGHRDVRDLLQRRHRAVVVDADGVDEGRRGTTGADAAELLLQVLERLVGLQLEIGQDRCVGFHAFTVAAP